MKKATKKDKILITIAVIGIMVTMTLCLFHIKPDWKYMLSSIVTASFHSSDVSLSDTDELQTMSYKILAEKDIENISEDQSLMLVNKNNTIPANFTADLTDYNEDGLKMNSCMTKAFKSLSDDVFNKFGENLYIMSGYRTAEEQLELYNNQGGSTAEIPGASEHQTGLALDVYVNNYAGYGFLKSETGQYVNSECWKYGFIIRYPMLKSDITGIDFEPWHIRYVGIPHAEIIYKKGITLEEYAVYA
ncbi:MAG: M15 family metallopeptidase [Ruminococcus sp.]|nr:M15 family metallopeptidase [Ruminococcus sp.]